MLWLTALLSLAAMVFLSVIEIDSIAQITQKPFSLIYFSAPDCRYCAAFNPDFEYISTLYNGNENFQVVKVNGLKHKDLVRLFEVTSFPTLKLYDTSQKKVTTYTSLRIVDEIELFIQENTGAAPNFDDLPQTLKEISTSEDVDALILYGKAVLAFVSRQTYDWSTYYYPGHFYQRLSREFPEIKFGIVFADESDSALMERYRISNMPSAVLLDGASVKILNTLTTNQMMSYKITEEMVREFLGKADVKEENWFESVDALAKHAASVEYDGHKQRKLGMNVVESREGNMSIDEEYELLLSKVGL